MNDDNIQLEDFIKLKSQFEEKEKQFEHQFWIDSNINQLDDLMRLNYNKSIDEFAKVVLDFLADLTNAFSGMMYITESNTKLLNASAGYACMFTEFPKKILKFGEDSVGQAASSKKIIIYENILPSIGTKLSSIELNPTTLIYIPLIFNEVVYGVIELVFLNSLPSIHKDFLQKISRNVAIMIESIANTTFTKKLLQESQELTEKLQAQEEELRQNNEELITTQEELNRRGLELNAQLLAINHSAIAKVEFNTDGMIEYVNQSFCTIFGYDNNELMGKHHSILVSDSVAKSTEYQKFCDDLKQGIAQAGEYLRKAKNGNVIWLNSSFSNIYTSDGRIHKIIELAFDVTKSKLQHTEIQLLVKKLQIQEQELIQNLEDLKATQEILERKNSELENKEKELQLLIAEMKINEEDMQKSEMKFRDIIKNFQKQTLELEEKNKLIEILENEIEKLKINN